MKLAYDFDIDDWQSFQRYHFSASATYRRMRNMARLLLPVILGIALGVYYFQFGFEPIFFVILGLVAVLWFIFYPPFFDRRVLRKVLQQVREGKMENLFGRREVELLPDAIRVTTPVSETVYRAAAVVKTVETPDAFLLYTSAIQAMIIPKRKISEVELHAVREFLQQHCPVPVA